MTIARRLSRLEEERVRDWARTEAKRLGAPLAAVEAQVRLYLSIVARRGLRLGMPTSFDDTEAVLYEFATRAGYEDPAGFAAQTMEASAAEDGYSEQFLAWRKSRTDAIKP